MNMREINTRMEDRGWSMAPSRAVHPLSSILHPRFRCPRFRAAPRRGAAMLLVLSVLAVAAVLGYAMLSIASIQRQLESNARRGPEAEGLAESGVNLAIYYLL